MGNMTYADAVRRYTDLMERLADLIEGADWDEPEDPDEEDEEPDEGSFEPVDANASESTATPVYAIAGGQP